jgi:hypothetical protein
LTCESKPNRSKTSRLKETLKQDIKELQKGFDEISALIKKTLPQIEEMKNLQIKIQEARKKINAAKDSATN